MEVHILRDKAEFTANGARIWFDVVEGDTIKTRSFADLGDMRARDFGAALTAAGVQEGSGCRIFVTTDAPVRMPRGKAFINRVIGKPYETRDLVPLAEDDFDAFLVDREPIPEEVPESEAGSAEGDSEA